MHQNKVSVVIPAYNRAQFIPNAVKSVINQEYDNIEIIIVDDRSNDNTQTVVNSLQQHYACINYCLNERTKGPSGARNTGLLKATGNFIAFLDSDDIWLEHHLTEGMEIFSRHPEIDVLFGNFISVDFKSGDQLTNFFDQKEVLHTLNTTQPSPGIKILQDNLLIALSQENFLHLGSIILRKSIMNGILLDESIMFAEDRDFGVRLYEEAKATFAYRENPVFILYRHDSNSYNTGMSNLNIIEAHIYLLTKYLRTYNLSKRNRRILVNLTRKKLLLLSYAFSKKKDFRNSLSCFLKGLNIGFSGYSRSKINI